MWYNIIDNLYYHNVNNIGIIMRCRACNKNLNDFESTRKHPETGEFIDLCNHCYHEVDETIYADEREDLREGDDELFEEDQIEIDLDDSFYTE